MNKHEPVGSAARVLIDVVGVLKGGRRALRQICAGYPDGQAFSAAPARPAAHYSQTLQEQIDRPVAALLALAFELAVAHQTIEPRADLAIIGGADQPRDRCAG
jgi:hypothetical protein